MGKQELIDYQTICAAVSGKDWAIEKVIAHYADYIEELSTVEIIQPDGSVIKKVNEEIKSRITAKLIAEIKNFPLD